MHRGQKPRANDERAQKRQREGQDRQQNRPAFQRAAFFCHDGRMQERSAQKPGHEADVFDRVPEPPAAPAKLVIGPPRSQGDASRQAHPRGQRPGPDPPRPGGIHPALDQARDRKGEHDRKADITDIKQRRMQGEAHILQQRVQVIAIGRRRKHPLERVRGKEHEAEEADADPGLNGQCPGAQPFGDIGAKDRHRRAEYRQDQHPEQQRSLVTAPCAGDLQQ